MKTAFSLLEIIVVLVIISILLSIAVFKNTNHFKLANKLLVQTQVKNIQNKIQKDLNSKILKGEKPVYPQSLDLKKYSKDIEMTNDKKSIGKWIKKSNNNFQIILSQEQTLDFTYNPNNGMFSCVSNHELCKAYD